MGLLLGALKGLILGGASAVALCVLAAWAFDIQQMEGAYAMAVAFVWTPLGAITGAVAGALLRR